MRFDSVSDEALACQARTGNDASFEELVRRHGRAVFGFLRRLVRDGHAAEDLAQATFVKAYRNLHRFDADRPFRTWLFTIAHREAVSHLRRTRPAHTPPADRSAGADARAPDRILIDAEARERLWTAARQALDDRAYAALTLRYAEDMDIAEVAAILNVSGIHARVLLHRARATLVRLFRTHPDEAPALEDMLDGGAQLDTKTR